MLPPPVATLRQRLQGPLPGLKAQLEMTSISRGTKWEVRADYRESSVLALLYPKQQELYLALMQRTDDGRVHGGQISFPGGKAEPEDRDRIHTALREAKEELNIDPAGVEVLGELTQLYIPPSNFMVYPVVGYAAERPDFVPDPHEVARVIEVPVGHLLQAETRQQRPIFLRRQQIEIEVPAFLYGPHVIWGATSMMLNELLLLLGREERIS
jgi:8-oxo-dGTP pyrophosphatase MutT (NUDIX family)